MQESRSPKRITKPAKPLKLDWRPHTRLTLDDKRRIVHARFLSLTDFSTPRQRLTDIARRFRLPIPTVYYTLKRFREQGYNFARLGDQRVRFAKLTPEMQTYLLRADVLRLWAPYSNKQRLLLIRDLFGVTIKSPNTLRRFYLAHDVRYQAAKKAFYMTDSKRAIIEEDRRSFGSLLANLVVDRAPLIYMDESSFHS